PRGTGLAPTASTSNDTGKAQGRRGKSCGRGVVAASAALRTCPGTAHPAQSIDVCFQAGLPMSTARATLTPTVLRIFTVVFASILAASCGGGAAPDLQTQTDPPVRAKANVTPIGFPGGSIPSDANLKGMWSPV